MIRPLEGITILDLSSILMVPYCTRILADLGADVIKIESLVGDNTRYIGPYENKSMGAVFLNLNRNKKSVSVDLKTCLLYTSPSPRDGLLSRMPSSA